jgi:phage shock protein A
MNGHDVGPGFADGGSFMKAWPDWDEFLRRLREDPVFREEVRRQVLTEDLLNLPAVVSRVLDLQGQTLEAVRGMAGAVEAFVGEVRTAFGRVEAQIASLTEQVRENSRQIASLTERMERVEGQIAALTERMDRVEAQIQENSRQIAENSRQIASLAEQVRENSRQMADLAERVERLRGDVGRLRGADLERWVRRSLAGLFPGGVDLQGALLALPGWAAGLGPKKRVPLATVDFIVGWRRRVFVGEVSVAVLEEDVRRVLAAKEILLRMGRLRPGVKVMPVVVGEVLAVAVPKGVGWIRWAKRRPEAFSPNLERLLRAAPAGPERVEDFIEVERP